MASLASARRPASLEVVMMTRSVKPLMFLATFYSATAGAFNYNIDITFATGPDQPTRIVLSNQYCMSQVPDVVDLKGGRAVIPLETNGGVFSKCGWVHSSATFVAQNNKKEKKLVLEFYKPLAEPPSIKILWPHDANCKQPVKQGVKTPGSRAVDPHLRGSDHKLVHSENPPYPDDTFYLVCYTL